MKSKKLAIVGGLLVLLLLVSIVTGCGSKANPMEDISGNKKTEGPQVITRDPSDDSDMQTSRMIRGYGKFSLSDVTGYPKEPPVASGTVQKVTSTTLDLESPTGGMGGVAIGEGGVTFGEQNAETKTTQIIFNRDTEVYKEVMRLGMEPPMELKEASINDIGQGTRIFVWGEEQGGDRILATVIIIGAGQ